MPPQTIELGALRVLPDGSAPFIVAECRSEVVDMGVLAPYEPDLTAPAPPEPAPRPRNRWPLIIGAVGVSPAASGRERM